MKRILFTFSIICICFYSSTLTAQTIPNDSIGGVDFYSWAPSSMTKSLDTLTPISGNNSLKLELTSIGAQWTLQARVESFTCKKYPINFMAGYMYRMTYKIRSSVPETILHYFHIAVNPVDYQENVTLAGNNVVETKTFTTPVIAVSGVSDFSWYWELGYPATPGTITIDDIVIEEVTNAPEGIVEHTDNPEFEAYCISKQLNVRNSVNSKIEVLDLTGRIIFQHNATGNELITIPMNVSGLVLVRATDANGIRIVRKVIVQ
jgi:hypothetical protein